MAYDSTNGYPTYTNATTTQASGTFTGVYTALMGQTQSSTGLYPQGIDENVFRRYQQQDAFQQFLRETMMNATGTWRFKKAEPLRPLETRMLSASERADLEKELPF